MKVSSIHEFNYNQWEQTLIVIFLAPAGRYKKPSHIESKQRRRTDRESKHRTHSLSVPIELQMGVL